METYKKSISENEFVMIVGLMELARQSNYQTNVCQKAIGKILNYKDSYCGHSYIGLLSDAIYESREDVSEVLGEMGIKTKC